MSKLSARKTTIHPREDIIKPIIIVNLGPLILDKCGNNINPSKHVKAQALIITLILY